MAEKIKKFWNKYPWVFGIILGAIAILIYYFVRKRQTEQPQAFIYQPPANAGEQQTQNLMDLMQQNIDVLKQQLNEQQQTFKEELSQQQQTFKEELSQQQQAINQQHQALFHQIESITNAFESKLQAIADIVNQKQNVSTQPVYIPPATVNVSPPTPTVIVSPPAPVNVSPPAPVNVSPPAPVNVSPPAPVNVSPPAPVNVSSSNDTVSEIMYNIQKLKEDYARAQAMNAPTSTLQSIHQTANDLRQQAMLELKQKYDQAKTIEEKGKILKQKNELIKQIAENKEDPKQVLGEAFWGSFYIRPK